MNWTDEQLLAINEKNKNIIVSAGAGSGKTAVLTTRVLRIINEGVRINELLILTFTKAAAEEMKDRIRSLLKENDLVEELNYLDQAYITTFDSFSLSVVKKYHYLLNISKNINITEKSIIDLEKNKILNKIFEEYYKNENQNFLKLIDLLCSKDDERVKMEILKIANKIDGLINRDEFIKEYLENFYTENNINNLVSSYEKSIKIKIEEIKEKLYELSMVATSDYMDKINGQLNIIFETENIDELVDKINLVKIPSLFKASDEEKMLKEEVNSLYKDLKEILNFYGKKENLISSINECKSNSEIIIEIVKKYLNEFHKYKEENELYDFQDVELLAIKLVKEYESVANELKNSFKEIMIDEYQDTNDVQETFISYISDNNVYMVGDIKQSIYRFRNANPYIFKNKYDNYSNGNNGLKIDLVNNFRSREEVLSNINKIFCLIMDDFIGGANYKKEHQMDFGLKKYNEEKVNDYNYDFEILEYDPKENPKFSKEEIEIFTIANDIKNKINNNKLVYDKDLKKLRKIAYNDFVILMDRSSEFDLYKKIFEYLGIPLNLYKEDKMASSTDLYLIKNIIDFIVKISKKNYDQEFKYDFISIARSFLFNMSDDEIFKYFLNNNFNDSDIYKMFESIAIDIDSKTPDEILYMIINKTNLYEKSILVGDIYEFNERINKLIEIAINMSSIGYDIYHFMDYLKELLDQELDIPYESISSNSNSVKIMTIHKSKGLEFPICYYSGLYKTFNIKDTDDKLLLDDKYGIISPYYDNGIKDTILKYLMKENYISEEISEKIRLFYVALTRAREKMILLTPYYDDNDVNKKNILIPNYVRLKYRCFSDILNSLKMYLKNYYKKIDLKTINLVKDYIYNIKSDQKIDLSDAKDFEVNELPKYNIELIEENHFSKENHKLIDKQVYDNMNFGTYVHECLEIIDFQNPDYSFIKNEFVVQKIKSFLSQDLLKKVCEAKIYKEYEFIYIENDIKYHGIIDLMLEYSDHIDIIDYKLKNTLDDNYDNQIEGYKKYISSLTNKEINIYLYSIIDEKIYNK